MPAWMFRREKSLDLCGLQRAETEQVVLYPSKAQKCLSIVPHSTEKAGKKSLTSYPLFVATCLPAVKLVCFQTFLMSVRQKVDGLFISTFLTHLLKYPIISIGRRLFFHEKITYMYSSGWYQPSDHSSAVLCIADDADFSSKFSFPVLS